MTRGLILGADGVSDSHLEYAYHRLREDAVLVDIASPDGGVIRGQRGGQWDTVRVGELPPDRAYDLVVIPGGDAPAELATDGSIRRWLPQYIGGDGIVCAVAEGVRVLLGMGTLEGRLATAPASMRADLERAGARPTGESVTVDGPFVTARDTDALPFAIAATLGNVAIPQGPAAEASERPHWTASDSA